MRVFLAGGSGAVGKRLVPLLVANKHSIVATTRNPQKAERLRSAGAEPVIMDGLDREGMLRAVQSAKPDVVVHQLTALAALGNLRNWDEEFALTNRLRTEGIDYLLEAARAAGARRFIAQSYTGWPYARTDGSVKTESDSLDPTPPHSMRRTQDAIRHVESVVPSAAGMEGIVLRYGSFYGPGTSIAADGQAVQAVRARKLPIIGAGGGIWSFVHIDDVATATLAALERGAPGLYNVVDDEPAPVAVWLPELARILGAKEPRRLPVWLAGLVAGDGVVSIMTEARGASNAKAKRELRWHPVHASWRDGFRKVIGDPDRSEIAAVDDRDRS